MVGDLVLLFGDTPARVDAIGNTEVYVYEKERGDWHVGYEHIKPIPITPEILEKNGFGEYEYNEVYGDEIEVEVSLYEWPIDEGSCPGFSTHLHYVHELQHALRLCGIEKEVVL